MTAPRRARRPADLGAATLVAGSLAAAAPQAAAQGPALRADTAGQGLVSAAAASGRVATPRAGTAGPAADVLRAVLARPHILIVAPDTGLTLGRGVVAERTLVIVGGPVRVAATVRGDVLATGDLFLRPGASIDGRAVALGGGVYGSTLARVGDQLSYRDVAVTRDDGGAGGIALGVSRGRTGPATRLRIPVFYGLRFPAYDRVNGVSVPFGPELSLDTGRVVIEPIVTYRSQLGRVDPGLHATAELPRGLAAELRAERGTFTNDAWSRVDVINSIVFAGTGGDARNYYRADRAELTLVRPDYGNRGIVQPIVGLRYERASSAERDSTTSRPFTLFGRDDAREGARRPNPAVTGGRIASALVGVRVARDAESGTRGRAELRVEEAFSVERGGRFTRAVLDLALQRLLPGDQSVVLLGHGVATRGANVPSQRYAYLGGGPTLPSLYLLEQGGTQVVWAEGRYGRPLRVARVPVVNTYPVLTLRGIVGAAGVDRLPGLTPNVGVRLNVGPLRADYVLDPRGRGRRVFSLGVGLR